MTAIIDIHAREVLDSRGNPTVEVDVVLEDGSMRRIGSLKERRVNVRLLAATNRNLQAEVQAGREAAQTWNFHVKLNEEGLA